MADVTIYTTPICGYCAAAKRLLEKKGVTYLEIDVMRAPERRAEMMERASGRHTVPQIFIGEKHIGGFDDMAELDRRGNLDSLLNA